MKKLIRHIKLKLRKVLLSLARFQMDFWIGLIVKSRPDWNPRSWSNKELRKIAHLFTGSIINVGAWKDGDKERGKYRSYFNNARSYDIANYDGEDGLTGQSGELYIDLSKPLEGTVGVYDLVFSHTVLEHVYPTATAFDNICGLSHNHVLAVVPFLQCYHGKSGSYDDYTRYSPESLKQLFRERGFEVVYLNWNEDFPVMEVYIVVLATKNPIFFEGKLPSQKKTVVGKIGPGINFSHFLWGHGPKKSFGRKLGEFIGINIHVADEFDDA